MKDGANDKLIPEISITKVSSDKVTFTGYKENRKSVVVETVEDFNNLGISNANLFHSVLTTGSRHTIKKINYSKKTRTQSGR